MQSREEIARLEVGHTNVTTGVARALVGWFLLMLVVLPMTEFAGAAFGTGGSGPWPHLTEVPNAVRERLAAVRAESPEPGAWRALVASNRAVLRGLNAFETALEDQSVVGRALRPPTQWLLSGTLGAGNERVYVGRDGWLFYRPDVEYVTGRGFLDARELRRRVASASEYEAPPQPDPRLAILQFKRDLEAQGIVLVLLPTPVKPTVHPEWLWDGLAPRSDEGSAGETSSQDAAARVDGTETSATTPAVHNASYDTFIEQMTRAGVLVFDPSAELARAGLAAPQYLATDTHWRPDSMQRVAEALAAFLERHLSLPHVVSPGYDAQRREARQMGDTAAMLDLPAGQSLYPPERVTLRFITDAAGNPWRSSRDADVLLLGDSFTNMYSLATMGWGEAAGFAEQLSYSLRRPLDRIVQNDQGAYATRALLAREVREGTGRLAGKRVVIWQFAARELAGGDWQVIEMPMQP